MALVEMNELALVVVGGVGKRCATLGWQCTYAAMSPESFSGPSSIKTA